MPLESRITRFQYFHSNDPQSYRTQSVVQLDVEGQLFLRAGVDYHYKILWDFLQECKRAGEPLLTEEEAERFIQRGRPADQAGKYKAVGMGKVEIDAQAKTLRFHGYSQGYYMEINPEHLEQMKKYLPEWTLKVKGGKER